MESSKLTTIQQFLVSPNQVALLEGYFHRLKRRPDVRYSPDSIENYRKGLLAFARHHVAGTGRQLDLENDVSREALYVAMCQTPSNFSATRRQMKWALRSFADYMVREGRLDASVGVEIQKLKVAPSTTPPTRALTISEINQVLNWLLDGGNYDPGERVTLAALFATYAMTWSYPGFMDR